MRAKSTDKRAFVRLRDLASGLRVSLVMQVRHNKCLIRFSFLLGFLLWETPLHADSSAEALCEKLYSDLLNKAKQALNEGKRDQALRFLVEAATVTERCASSPEPRQRGAEENVLASAPETRQVT
jgi:hypothetical protein